MKKDEGYAAGAPMCTVSIVAWMSTVIHYFMGMGNDAENQRKTTFKSATPCWRLQLAKNGIFRKFVRKFFWVMFSAV